MNTFKELNLAPSLEKILDDLGFIEPTEIQQKAIPLLLSHKKIDFHGQAQTGTGKTLAFGIPLLHKIDSLLKSPQALVVAPTRELALQIKESIAALGRAMNIRIEAIYGGVSMEDQIGALKRGCHIVVGTPGRLNDHLRRKTLSVSDVKTLVLDEADIMLDMGFKEEVDEILNYVSKNREIWLFSATTKSGIADIMKSHMQDTISVRVSKKQVGTEGTKQYYCVVPHRSKMQALHRFIESAPDFYGFIFCQTKILTSDVAEQLIKRGYNVGALHGDMSQAQRNIVIKKFKSGELSIVVATDVAARGIDVANLTHVINYSAPEDHESYIHRIGRTGRAGKEGIAITLISKQEVRLMHYLQRKFMVVINPIDVPSRETIVKARIEEAQRYMTEIMSLSPSIDPSIEEMISSLSFDQIRASLAYMLHNKFLGTVEQDDISFTPSQRASLSDELQEIFINVGSDDGVTRDDVIAYLTKTGCVKDEQIQKVRVIKRRSFIQLPAECINPLIHALRGSSLGGRRARINLTEDTQRPTQHKPRFM